ncbi:MAG: dihydrofolate reductase [Phycisphaerales bacterium]
MNPGSNEDFDPRAFHARFDYGLIVACSENGVIGREGDLPWHLPADLRHFMRSTRDCAVVMGRRTYESLDTPLPHRLNIVVSTSMGEDQPEGVRVARDLEQALDIAREARMQAPIWIAGGGTIYTQTMDMADLIVRTLVHTRLEGDTGFPEIDPDSWELVRSEAHESDDRHIYGFAIEWWTRKQGRDQRITQPDGPRG